MNSPAAADQARGENSAVIEHQQIAGAKQFRKLAEDVIAETAGGAIHPQQARGVPPRGGMLGDALRRQRIVEIFEAQNLD